MKTDLALYHGSPEVVSKPMFGFGNVHNDYGMGFYCTEHPEIAKEWACKDGLDGHLNEYRLKIKDLSILYLNKDYSVMNWLAVLVHYRPLNFHDDISHEAVSFLTDRYLIDLSGYDLVIGYRVDDKYYNLVRRFLSNRMDLGTFTSCMSLGKLGEQVVLKSERAFDLIEFLGSEPVSSSQYYPKYHKRMECAMAEYVRRSSKTSVLNGRYILDIMREES